MRPPTLTACNLAELRPTDPMLNVYKDLNPSSKHVSNISKGWQYFKGKGRAQITLTILCQVFVLFANFKSVCNPLGIYGFFYGFLFDLFDLLETKQIYK